jgi:PTS system nitrogen regulatory IIA component
MSGRDFNVEELAAYLHLTPDQVVRMASRERLPGRRVSGSWRFPRAEIHHWLEETLGQHPESRLVDVAGVLERSGGANQVKLGELLSLESIDPQLDARTPGSVIRQMCQLASQTGLLWDHQMMAEAVRAREQLHPTALHCGVALLHPRRPQSSILADSVLALGITPQPLPFGNSDGYLTDVFFLILSIDDRTHLQILSRLSRLIGESGWLEQLREASTAADILELVRQREADMDEGR